MNIPDASVGAIIASVIGAGVVFISTLLTKEQKTSEFRQAWVDALRNELAEYIAGVGELVSVASYYAEEMPDKKHEFMTGQHERMAHLRSLGTRIKLRLNPKEHAKLMMLVENYVINMVKEEEEKEKAGDDKEDTLDTDSIHEKELMKEAQRVLKLEWKRVKTGEIAFRITKYAALSVSILALCYVINTVFFSTSNSSPLRPMKTASIIQHHNKVC